MNPFLLTGSRISQAWKALTGSIPFQGSGGGTSSALHGGAWWRDNTFQSTAGRRFDLEAEVGDIRNSSLFQSGARWIGRGLNSARLQIVELDADSKETDIRNHPVANLFHRPNPLYSGSALMAGIGASWLFGEAHLLKVKSQAGQTIELWWEPNDTIRPRWPDNGTQFISHYEIWRSGKWLGIGEGQALDFIQPLVFWDGPPDPLTRRASNPMASLLSEYYTDNQAALFMAKLLRNGLVPPVVVGLGSKDFPFQDDANHSRLKEFQAALTRKMTGDSAGEPMVTEGAAAISKLGFDYSSVGLRDVRQIPEERFCSVIGISPHSLHFGASTGASTFSNVAEFLKQDYQGYIVPLQDQLADEIDRSLLPEFDTAENIRTAWNYDKTPLMQSDRKVEAEIATLLYKEGVLKRSEAREMNGYPFDESDEVYISDVGASLGSQLLAGELAPDDFEESEPVKPNGSALN